MSITSNLEKDLAMQAMAASIETPKEVAKRLAIELDEVYDWCSTPQFCSLARRYGQDLIISRKPDPKVEADHKRDDSFAGPVAAQEEDEVKPTENLNDADDDYKQRKEHKPKKVKRCQNLQKRYDALADVRAGMSESAAARKHKVSRRTINRWCQSAEVVSQFKQGRPPTSDEQKDRAISLLNKEGLSSKEVGKVLGLSGETVRVLCAKAGVRSRFTHRKNRIAGREPTNLRKERVIAMMRDEHLTCAQASRISGVPESTIRGWCKEVGIVSPLAYKRNRRKS